MNYEMVIGLEVHAQLKTNSKLFSSAANNFGNVPNTNVTEVCLGMPGALPVLNKAAVEMAIKAGLALNCAIQPTSVFARKNYFYPDLPKGYQISQYELPICLSGHMDIETESGKKRIGITRIHMEEDAGKLLHQGADGVAGSTHSHVDLNRAGTPLIEIVSEPDMRSAKEARAYMEILKLTLQHIGVCDGNMEEGSLRIDVNLSLRPEGQKEFGTRTEVKNINSFRSLERAIASEYNRQKKLLEAGEKVIQQTRNYDDATQSTTPLRDKEDAHDYRYFPDPDLTPLFVSQAQIDHLKATLPELPQAKRNRYQNELQIAHEELSVLIEDLDMNGYFETCLKESKTISAKEFSKWVVGNLNALIKANNGTWENTQVTPSKLAALLELKESGKISGNMAKEVLEKLYKSGGDPAEIVAQSGGGQIADESALQDMVNKIIAANPEAVERFKSGKTNAADFLMGQVMKESKGRAKPDVVRALILESLK